MEVNRTSEAIEIPLAQSIAMGDRFNRKIEWLFGKEEKDSEEPDWYAIWLENPFDR